MGCTTAIVTGAEAPIPSPPSIPSPVRDKYYDCVNGKCIEKAGGRYKNDPRCDGKCIEKPLPSPPPVEEEEKPADWTAIIVGIAGLIGLAILFGGKK